MVDLVKQLMTSRLYWLLHDGLLKYWWVGALCISLFWVGVFAIDNTEMGDGSRSRFRLDDQAELSAVIDWDVWEKDKKAFERTLVAENDEQKKERLVKKKTEIEETLDQLKKRFPSRNYVYWKTVTAKVTAYTPDRISCGEFSDGKTSKMDNAYLFDGVAASPNLIPYRSGVYIPGYGIKEVDDTGGAMRQAASRGYYHIDVRVRTNREAKKWGVKWERIHLFKVAK